MTDKLLEALGLPELEEKVEILEGEIIDSNQLSTEIEENIALTKNQQDLINDIEYAKDNISSSINQALAIYKRLAENAKQSDTARDFEVAGGLLGQIVAANKEFVAISEKKKYAKEELPPTQTVAGQTNIQNNLFLSTHDILSMLEDINKKNS